MRQNILLVEDETDILLTNQEYLEMNGYNVITAESIEEAYEKLAEKPDLIVLDIMFEEGSGLDFCKDIRSYLTTPILFLSCLNQKDNIVEGLKIGGDDYLTKPYRLDELAARCAALLRRVEIDKRNIPDRMEFGPLVLDWLQRIAYLNGEAIFLKPKEFSLLLYLVKNAEQEFTASELYSALWGMPNNEDVRTVNVHICNLRKKLKMDEDSPFEISMKDRKYYIWHNCG